MNEDEPDAVASMLEYLYRDDYSLSYPSSMTKDSAEAKGHEMIFHLHVYALADRLRIPALKETASNYFSQLVHSYWNDPAFPSVVQFTYSITPPGQDGDDLRMIVVRVAGLHAKELVANSKDPFILMCPKDPFILMMEGLADFGKDLSQWLVENGISDSNGEIFTCPGCAFKFKATLDGSLEYLICPACTTNAALYSWRHSSSSSSKKKKGKKTRRSGSSAFYESEEGDEVWIGRSPFYESEEGGEEWKITNYI